MELAMIFIIMIMILLLFVKLHKINNDINYFNYDVDNIEIHLDSIKNNIEELFKLVESINENVDKNFNNLNEVKEEDVKNIITSTTVVKDCINKGHMSLYNKIDDVINMFEKLKQSKAVKSKTTNTTKDIKKSENQPKISK